MGEIIGTVIVVLLLAAGVFLAGRKLWRQRAGSVWNGTPGASTTAR